MERVALVTGANRGLGFETCRQLAKKGIQVILTSRDAEKGKRAAESLRKEGLAVDVHQLDVTDASSISQAAELIQRKYGRLDILVNNAGIMLDSLDPEESSTFTASTDTIKKTMQTNTFGPLLVSQALIPLLMKSAQGRIVNVSSGMGQLSEMGGSCVAYRFSKVCLNALTRILADELRRTNIKVNSVCPGWVRTNMGGPNAQRSVEEGASGIVWAATLPDSGPSGGFFRDGKRIPW